METGETNESQTTDTEVNQETEPGEQVEENNKAAPVSTDAKNQDSETASNEDQEQKQEADADVDGKPDEKHRRKGGYQRTIERLERQNQILVEQLSRSGQAPQAPVTAKEKSESEKAQEALDSWLNQKLNEREAQRQEQARQTAFAKQMDEARASIPDFDEALMSVSDIRVPPEIQQALLMSERAPHIMYTLAKNRAELARISALPPLAAAVEIGKLEAKAFGASPQRQNPKSAARPPAPPTNVGGSVSSTRNLDDLPISDYKRAYRSGRR